MRNKDVYIITCSKCDKENRYEDYSCVEPDQRESIIDDSIMTYTCPPHIRMLKLDILLLERHFRDRAPSRII